MSAAGTAHGRAIEKRATVSAPRDDVWRAWTTSEGLTEFLCPRCHVELRPGGPYEIIFNVDAPDGDRGSEGCRVLAFVPGRMLAFTWNSPPTLPATRCQRTTVVVELADAPGGGTEVVLTNGGYVDGPNWDAAYAYFDRAWGFVLAALERRFVEGPRFSDAELAAAREKVPVTGPPENAYLILLHPVRDDFFETGATDAEKAAIGEHFRHLQALHARGRLVLAGPSFAPSWLPDAPGLHGFDVPEPGIVVFTARDEAEARSVMEADPAVRARVFRTKLSTFRTSLVRDRVPA